MKVTMRTQISGTRDGADWPAPGGTVDLPDDEAAMLVANHMALPAGAAEDGPADETADADPVAERAVSGPARRKR